MRENYHEYTEAERDLVRSLYPSVDAPEIARRIFGDASRLHVRAIHNLAHRLGLRKLARHTPQTLERVRELHAAGLTDAEIGRALSMTRGQIKEIRSQRLKLPTNTAAVRRVQRQNAYETCRRLGVTPGGQLRRLAFRRRAAAAGWPEDLTPREIEIVELLLQRGPMTRPEICAALGLRWRGSRKSLTSRGRGSHLANLAAKGLIVRVKRGRTVHGQGRGRTMDLYLVPLWVWGMKGKWPKEDTKDA